jgi:acyl-CoA reductase-like NAD-dependent aldehyde dehydrogenase
MCIAVFAPIMLVMPYDTVPEAIEIANSTRYGLGASVWGPDETLCAHVAKELECGMVAVNDFGVFYVSHLFRSLRTSLTLCIVESRSSIRWYQGLWIRPLRWS